MNQEPISRELALHESTSNDVELKILGEKVRDLEKALRDARAVADEALRIAKRAKRGLVVYHCLICHVLP